MRKIKIKLRTIRFDYLLFLFLLYFSFGCSDSASYKPGWYTTRVEGQFKLEASKNKAKSFILVQEHNRTFIQTSQGYLHNITAKVVFPDNKGHYQVEFPTGADQLDLFFYAEGYVQQAASYKRSLGIGAVELDIKLEKDADWRNTFFFTVRPFLSGFIVNPDYKLPPANQLFLGEWLNQQSLKLRD